MKQFCMFVLLSLLAIPAFAQMDVPDLPFESVPFLKITPDRNLGEVLAVAMNSKGHLVVLNHPGTSATGGCLWQRHDEHF